jgi:hypothetical protein
MKLGNEATLRGNSSWSMGNLEHGGNALHERRAVCEAVATE